MDVPEGQGPRAARLLGLTLAMSLALVLLKAAQSGIFLAAYPRDVIPRAFGVSAVALALLSAVQVVLTPRVGPLKLTSASLLGSAAALVALFVALGAGVPSAAFVLYVVVEVASGLMIIQVWTVTSGALDPRSAKRILPLCGLASSGAWAAGGALAGPLGHALGAWALLLIGAGLLVVTALAVFVVGRRDYAGRDVTGRKRPLLEGWKAGLAFVRETPLMRVSAVLSVLALATEQLMDFVLMAAAASRYDDPEAIGAFFGHFYAVTSGVSMLLLMALSSRLMARLGASRALALMPLATLLFAIPAALTGAFAAAVLLRGTARVLKQAVWGTSQEQVQTPLPVMRRSQARALVRGVLAPAGYAALAGALSFLPKDFDLRWLAAATALGSAGMVALILVRMRPAYLAALKRALDDRRLDLEGGAPRAAGALDKDTLATFLRELASHDEEHAVLAAEVLGDVRDPEALPGLIEAAGHPSTHVRRLVLEALGRRTDSPQAAAAVTARLLEETDATVRACAAAALRGLPWTEAEAAAVRAACVDEDSGVRALCRVARFEREGRSAAELLRLLDDDECRDVALTAVTRELAADPAVQEKLGALLRHDDAATKIAALRCVSRLRWMPLLADVTALLEDPRCAVVAATELSGWGDEALDVLAAVAKFDGGESTGSFYKMARARWAEEAYPVLVRLLGHRDAQVRAGAGRVLCGLVGVGDAEPLLRLEVERIFHYYGILAGLAFGDGKPDWTIDGDHRLLGEEIELHIRLARERLLQLLYLLDEERIVHAVEVGLRRPTPRLAAQVAELLELTLEPRLARRIVPLFDSLSLRERVEAARRLGALDESALRDPLGSIVELGDPHLRRVAMLVYGSAFAERFAARFPEDETLLALYDRMRFLRSVPLFSRLAGDDLRSLAEIVEEVEVPAGHRIFREGDPGDNLFLILSGHVDVEHQGRRVARLGERDVLGELAVLDHEPRSADAVVAEDARLLRLRAVDLEELLTRRPQIQAQFVQVLVQRLRNTLDAGAAEPRR